MGNFPEDMTMLLLQYQYDARTNVPAKEIARSIYNLLETFSRDWDAENESVGDILND